MAAAAAAAGSIPHIHYTLAAMVGKEEAGRLCLSITPGGGGKLEKKTNNQRGKPQPNLRLVTTAFAFFSLSLSLSHARPHSSRPQRTEQIPVCLIVRNSVGDGLL